jgi:Flp pilus assembly protein TadB
MRLLAGYECQRDAAEAQVMLVQLSESKNSRIASDAQAIISAAVKRDWFGQRTPFLQDLEQLAERTRGGRSAGPSVITLKIALVAGVLMLALLLGLFLQRGDL